MLTPSAWVLTRVDKEECFHSTDLSLIQVYIPFPLVQPPHDPIPFRVYRHLLVYDVWGLQSLWDMHSFLSLQAWHFPGQIGLQLDLPEAGGEMGQDPEADDIVLPGRDPCIVCE